MTINNMKYLLIVDVQKGFINNKNVKIIPNIEKWIKSPNFDRIIATKFINKPDSQYFKQLNWQKMTSSPDIDLAFKLQNEERVTIVEKTSYALPQQAVNSLFDEGAEIYICGLDYDACVLAIGFQLFDLGFKVSFLLDSISTANVNPMPIKYFKNIILRNFGEKSIIEKM